MVGAAAKFRNNERYNLHRGNTSINDRFIKLSEIYRIIEDNTSGITQAELDAAIAALVGTAPVGGDTLGELYILLQGKYSNIDISLVDFQALAISGVQPLTTYKIFDAIDGVTSILVTTDSSGSFNFDNSLASNLTNATFGNYDANNDLFTALGTGTGITVVANYSALPNPTTVSEDFYWVSASQGTSWLPGSLGGTYYNKGIYYSNGTTWEYIDTPYQATQSDVNTGTNTDQFVTPATLNSYSGWTKTKVGLGNVENTALSTWSGTSNITTLGIVSTGTWQATLISSTYGGVGVDNGGRTFTYAANIITTGTLVPTLAFPTGGSATYTYPSATSTLLANSLGLSTGTTLIGGTGATGSIIFQDTSNSTNSLNTNHFIWKMTTAAGALEENLRMGNAAGGEMNLYSMGNVTQYWLRSTVNVSYFNAATDLRLQCGAYNLLVGTTNSISLRQATTMFTAMSFTFAAGTTTVAPAIFQSGTNKTTASAGCVEYNGTNLFFTRTGSTREYVLVGASGATAPATNAIGVIVDYYGTSATRVLTTPNSWITYVEGATTYKIPAYT